MKPAKRVSDKQRLFLFCAALVLAVVVAFEPVRHNQFVDFDDNEYITENLQVQEGISGESIKWAFTTPHFYLWHPLTSLSHMLDYELFGLNAAGHHLVGLLFHIANSLLLFWILRRITGAFWCSAFVAGVFALHPLSVESVAWASERKNVLSTFFLLLTIASYVYYAKRPSVAGYLIVLLFFCLALLAKPAVVTLPFVLLLLDYWPLYRFQSKIRPGRKNEPESQSVGVVCRKLSKCRLILEKIPMLLLVTIVSVITFMVQRSGNIVASLAKLPIGMRFANAGVSYVRYMRRMIWPSDLAMYYPYHSLSALFVVACFAILIAVTAAVIVMIRRRRYPVVGWFWFLGTLVPVIGLVQVGSQAMADRYTYLSGIGIYIVVAWGTAEILGGWRHREVVLTVSCGVLFLAMIIATRSQVRHWRDTCSLYGHTLAVTRDNRIIHKLFGDFLRKQGRLEDAVEQYREALEISPAFQEARKAMVLTLLEMKEPDKATVALPELLDTNAVQPEAHVYLAAAYAKKGQLGAAERHFKEALRARPDWAEAHNALGKVYSMQKRYDLAIQSYREALRLRPDYPDAAMSLARVEKLKQAQTNKDGTGQKQ